MDAWGRLIAGSTIASGDAWEHLLAQGGGGVGEIIYVTGGLETTMDQIILTATMHPVDIHATISDHGTLSATAKEVPLSGAITRIELAGTIAQTELSGEIE